MKRIYTLLFLITSSVITFGQVGINNTDPKATLDISSSSITTPSNTDGLLIPRIDEFPVIDPTIEQDGMMVFVTGNGTPAKGFYFWNHGATSWSTVSTASTPDFYEIGSTVNPDNINDDIYTLGKLKIGQNSTANASLDVRDWDENNFSGITLSRNLTTAGPFGQLTGIRSTVTGTSTDNYTSISAELGGTTTVNNHSLYASNTTTPSSGTSYLQYGIFTSNGGTGNLVGNEAAFFSPTITNTGDKYGYRTTIASSIPGTHYGYYANVANASGYAAYFLGRTSLGNSGANRYIMPAADGTSGQVMTTDGAGQISFSTIAGNDIDWYEEGTTTAPNAISDNIFTEGNVGIGDNTPTASLDIDYSGTQNEGINLDYTHSNAGASGNGIDITASSGDSGGIIGAKITMENSNTSIGAIGVGVVNSANSSANSGFHSMVNGSGPSNSGFLSEVTSTGTSNYGIWSSASGATSNWAGYFANGNVMIENNIRVDGVLSIDDPSSSGYAFPAVDGTSGQVLTTDGAGQLTFNTISFTDTQNTLDEAYNEGGVGAGRTITANSGAVLIDGTDGIQSTGTVSSGAALTLSGAGTRFFFYPRKAAMRVGQVTGTQWDDSSIGLNSFAANENTIASGSRAFAIGYDTTASGAGAFAHGNGSVASGFNAAVFGTATSSGTHSFATGQTTLASGTNASTFGRNTTAPSYAEMAVGTFPRVYGAASSTTFDAADRAFVIGNGIGLGTQSSNAFEVWKNGRVEINEEYSLPTVDGTVNQVLTTNGAGQLSFTTLPANNDVDWYEEGTTTAPDDITDDIFTQGNVGIGTATINFPLQVETPASSRTVSLLNNNNGTSAYGIYNRIEESAPSTSGGSAVGLVNSITKTNQGSISGVSNGFSNSVATASFGYLYGVDNSFGTATANTTVGFLNRFQGTTNDAAGIRNLVTGTFTDFYGLQSYNIASGLSGNFYGMHNVFNGTTSNGNHYGAFTEFSNTGIGDKYGYYANITSSAGGTHYGMYVDVQKTTGYAAYLIGRTSLGTGISNRYLMPATDGNAGEVLTTDGSGNTSWQNNATPSLSLARIRMSTTQNVTGIGWNKVDFNTVDFDLNSDFNTSTDEFVVPTTGYYRIGGTWRDISDSTTNQFAIAIYVNGSSTRVSVSAHGGTGVLQRSINSLFALVAGSTVEIYCYHDSSITIDNNTLGSFFDIEQIR